MFAQAAPNAQWGLDHHKPQRSPGLWGIQGTRPQEIIFRALATQ